MAEYKIEELILGKSAWVKRIGKDSFWIMELDDHTFEIDWHFHTLATKLPSVQVAKQWLLLKHNVPTTGWKDYERNYHTKDFKWRIMKQKKWLVGNKEYSCLEVEFKTRRAALEWINQQSTVSESSQEVQNVPA